MDQTQTQIETTASLSKSNATCKRFDPTNLRLKLLIFPGDVDNCLPLCPANSNIYLGKTNWKSKVNILLAVYSTIFSMLWFLISLLRPGWGEVIRTGGFLAPSTASTIFALFSKTIEISSVGVLVTFLGQFLTRRSLHSAGFSISELGMRGWFVQPAYVVSHWNQVKLAGSTILGALSLLISICIMFFTTASDALVSPHLKYGHWENEIMYSFVKSSFANPVVSITNANHRSDHRMGVGPRTTLARFFKTRNIHCRTSILGLRPRCL